MNMRVLINWLRYITLTGSLSIIQTGQLVKARVIGFRLVDGLATLSMKKTVLDQEVRILYLAMKTDQHLKIHTSLSY